MAEVFSADEEKYPSLQRLRTGLAVVLEQSGTRCEQIEVLERRVNVAASTYPSEILICRIDSHTVLRLFCKYSAHLDHEVYGHRGGVEYETQVYEEVLQSNSFAPKYYGSYREEEVGRTWLILGYLANPTRVSRVIDSDALIKAARWLASFHAQNEARLKQANIPFMNHYDLAYYLGWAERAVEFAKRSVHDSSWMSALCAQFTNRVPVLLSAPQTVIHGEFYPANVLVYEGRLCPVDWESAAIATGEIDLACLTDRWPEQAALRCEKEYAHVRWSAGLKVDFKERLKLARIYVQLRWLGDRFEVTTKDCHWRFERLYKLGRQYGLLGK